MAGRVQGAVLTVEMRISLVAYLFYWNAQCIIHVFNSIKTREENYINKARTMYAAIPACRTCSAYYKHPTSAGRRGVAPAAVV